MTTRSAPSVAALATTSDPLAELRRLVTVRLEHVAHELEAHGVVLHQQHPRRAHAGHQACGTGVTEVPAAPAKR